VTDDDCDGAFDGDGKPFPQRVMGSLRFKAITTALSHTCALTKRGEAFCWGYNSIDGELGDGTTVDSGANGPQAVIGGLRFTSIEAGYFQTCATTRLNKTYCWGYNPDGQLGDGTTISSGIHGPQRVAGSSRFNRVATGGYHLTCALTTFDRPYCWGYNSVDGEIGDGTTDSSSTPRRVLGGLRLAMFTVGSYHTCGSTSRGVTYCWGYNLSGRLGDGTLVSTGEGSPRRVMGNLRFESLSAGDDHTCGLTKSFEAYCWGVNFYGQLGDGTRSDSDERGPQPVQ
jgi:alpha-tubulin suppressor-like RCC1 family protein